MKPAYLALLSAFAVGGLSLGATGCAKKKAPEAAEPGSAFQVELKKVELVRRDTTTVVEHGQLRYSVALNNGLKGGEVKVDRIEYSFGVGDRSMGSDTLAVGKAVASGATENLLLVGKFEWRDDSAMPAGDAWIKGTVHWTGPNAARSTTFDAKKAWVEVN